jgi:DNA polymerase-3 subunit chi
MEINIYKLNSQPFSKSFPRLLEAISDRGISTLVHCSDEQEVKKCDALLWSYDQLSFLGHSIKGEVHTLPQKIHVTDSISDNPYSASVLAFFNPDESILPKEFSKVVYMFSKGEDFTASEYIKRFIDRKLNCTIFEQKENGSWVRGTLS